MLGPTACWTLLLEAIVVIILYYMLSPKGASPRFDNSRGRNTGFNQPFRLFAIKERLYSNRTLRSIHLTRVRALHPNKPPPETLR